MRLIRFLVLLMKGVGFEFSELIDKIVAIGLKYADGNFK